MIDIIILLIVTFITPNGAATSILPMDSVVACKEAAESVVGMLFYDCEIYPTGEATPT